jgi:hypothetical protein
MSHRRVCTGSLPHWNNSRKSTKKQQPPHCPLALSNEQELQLCEMIQEKTITGNYVTKQELLNDVEANFHASLTCGWIRCFLEHRVDFVKKQLWHQMNCQDFKSRANTELIHWLHLELGFPCLCRTDHQP